MRVLLGACLASISVMGATRCTAFQAKENPPPTELLEQALSVRESVRVGRCRITGTLTTHIDESLFDIDYSFDFAVPAYQVKSAGKVEMLRTPKYVYHIYDGRETIYRNDRSILSKGGGGELFDIRSLGLMLKPTVLSHLSIVDFDVLKDRYLQATDLEVSHEEGLLKLSLTDQLKDAHVASRIHLWVDPQKGHTIQRMDVDYPGKPGELAGTTNMQWEQKNGWWVMTKLAINHGRLQPRYELNWEIEWSAVNEPLGDKSFTPNSLIGAGQEAVLSAFPNEGGNAVDIGIISNKNESSAGWESADTEGTASRSRILLLVGTVLAAIGIVLIVRARRNNQSS